MARVLILDEHVRVAQLLREELAQDGHHVVISTRGAEAISSASLLEPEILIMDPFISRRPEWDILKKIKSSNRDLPVIIYTAHQGLSGDPHAEMASAFVLKRSSLEEIRGLVRRLLPGKTAAASKTDANPAPARANAALEKEKGAFRGDAKPGSCGVDNSRVHGPHYSRVDDKG
ncbi:MAG: response regulator [bacterium]